MRADSIKISKVFSGGGDIHYVLPHFQRQYSWDETNWKTLLDDAFAIYDEYEPDKEPPEHFLGSLVVINDGTRNGVITAFNLVDGQQWLTTISLLFCALRDIVRDTHPGIAKKVQKMLVNPDEDGDVHFKILPTTKYGDREAYTAIIREDTPLDVESGIPQGYTYLHKELSQKIAKGEIEAERFFLVLSNCFQVVFIDLNHDESPYQIFESLNAKGKPFIHFYLQFMMPMTPKKLTVMNY